MTNGTMNNALALLLLEERPMGEDLEALYALLAERSLRYTMGDSTSLPVDTARRLLESILYCLALNRRFPNQTEPENLGIKARWSEGVRISKRIASRAKLLLLQAQRTQPPLVNTAYCDTLDALPAFFRSYDADFFAHEIPCSFDYPLCHPVSESLLGAEYMQEYLRRFILENTFLRAFPADAIRALYERYYIDYSDLLVNLYLPAAEMSILCALAGEPEESLLLSPEKLTRVGTLLSEASREDAERMMQHAALDALCARNLGGDGLRAYMQHTAQDLLIRLRAARITM